jgi:hypothetical protein
LCGEIEGEGRGEGAKQKKNRSERREKTNLQDRHAVGQSTPARTKRNRRNEIDEGIGRDRNVEIKIEDRQRHGGIDMDT